MQFAPYSSGANSVPSTNQQNQSPGTQHPYLTHAAGKSGRDQAAARSSLARSPQSPPTHPPPPPPARSLARSAGQSRRHAAKKKGRGEAPHLGSHEELVRGGGGGGGVAPATVAVHPLLVPLQREAPQLPQRRLHLRSPPHPPRRIEPRIAGEEEGLPLGGRGNPIG
jgi:hypothetical protein